MVDRCYSSLINLPTFEERFKYCRCFESVGNDTFGIDRFLNQKFYKSRQWLDIRNFVIARDNGCDLGIPGHEICYPSIILIHHLNPLTKEDITECTWKLLDPENLICVSRETHNALHYGGLESLGLDYQERTKNDTCPWR